MLLFFIRHGDPIYTPDSLTPQGELQSSALAKRLALYGLNRVFVSSAVRAQQTAEPTCRLLGLTPEVLDWTTEHHCSANMMLRWEGKRSRWVWDIPHFIRRFNSPEIRALGRDWATAPEFAEFPFAREMERVDRETDAFLAGLGYEHDRAGCLYRAVRPNEDRVALFAHQGFGMVFLSSLLDIPYPLFSTHFDTGHSSMTVVWFKHTDEFAYPRVIQLSNDSHLYRDGLPTFYQNKIRF